MTLTLLWGGEIFRGEGLTVTRIHSRFILTQSPNLLTNLCEISLRVIIQFVFLGCLGIQSSSLEQGKTLNFLSLPCWNVAFARWSLNFIKFIISIPISFPFSSKDIFSWGVYPEASIVGSWVERMVIPPQKKLLSFLEDNVHQEEITKIDETHRMTR